MWKPCEVIGWKLSGNNYQIDQLTKKHYTVIKCMKELNEALGAGAEEGGGEGHDQLGGLFAFQNVLMSLFYQKCIKVLRN